MKSLIVNPLQISQVLFTLAKNVTSWDLSVSRIMQVKCPCRQISQVVVSPSGVAAEGRDTPHHQVRMAGIMRWHSASSSSKSVLCGHAFPNIWSLRAHLTCLSSMIHISIYWFRPLCHSEWMWGRNSACNLLENRHSYFSKGVYYCMFRVSLGYFMFCTRVLDFSFLDLRQN